MEFAVMRTGKYRGQPLPEIPVDYLIWHAANIATPAKVVVDELERRAKSYGSRDAMPAAEAVASLLFRRNDRSKKGRKKWREMLGRNKNRRS